MDIVFDDDNARVLRSVHDELVSAVEDDVVAVARIECHQGVTTTKSLSHKAPHDERGGELHEREVVLGLLLPPDEQLAEVEPRVRALDYPPPCPLAAPAPPALLAPPPDVRHEVAAPGRRFGVGVVVALVQ